MDFQPPKRPVPRTQGRRRTQPNGRVQNTQNAIGYVRVSTEEQARFGVSLDAQTDRIRAYAVAQNLTLTTIIHDDGVSAAKHFESRPGGAQAAQILKTGQASHLIVYKLDRLFRDAGNALDQTSQWGLAGIDLHIIDFGGSSFNMASAMGRFFLTMAAAFAEMERNLIRERTALALGFKKQNLKAYSPTPFGFDRDGTDLHVNLEELAVVTRIHTLYTDGHSLRSIAAELNTTHTPTKKRGSWFASTVQKILKNTIHQK